MFFGSSLLNLSPVGLSKGNLPNNLSVQFSNEAQRENALVSEELFNRFSNIAVTRYMWSGLPETVSERFLNMALYMYGSAAFFYDSNMGFLALPCVSAGEYNVYYEPTRVNAFSFNYNKMLGTGLFAYIRNNPSATPTALPVFTYTKRMAEVLRTIDVVVRKLKQPYLIQCDESERLTIENMMKKVQDNEIMVVGSKQFGLKNRSFEISPTPVDSKLDELWATYRQLETILYTALGINSTGQEKKERLLVDEVNANNMVTNMSIEVNIKELQAACEKINQTFALDIWVEAKDLNDYAGGVYSGAFYNRTENTD